MKLALLLFLAACTPVDADGDGFAGKEDCDDGDAAIHPDAVEVCDGADVDEDCDGLADDDDPGTDEAAMTRAWKDSDADGLGDGASSGFFCDVPADHVADATDCDGQTYILVGACGYSSNKGAAYLITSVPAGATDLSAVAARRPNAS